VLGRTINEIEGIFGARANAVTDALEQRTRDFNDVLGARSGELAALLDGRSSVLMQTLDQRGNDIIEMLVGRSEEASRTLIEASDRVAANFTTTHDRLQREVGELTALLDGRSEALLKTLDERGSGIVATVVGRSEEASRTLLEAGDRVATSFATTNQKLKGEIAELAERLAGATDTLNGLLGTTEENLIKIEKGLAERAGEFSSAIGHAVETTQLSAGELGDQVTRLRDVSREILESVSGVVKRFEEQTHSLTAASRDLTDVNRQIETAVDQRRPALEALTSGLKARSEELDGLMSSFTRIITETLKSAEERATAVSRMLTENTATATKGVMDNLESMNRAASSESRKAAEAVREANKSLVTEMGQSVGEATRRFGEATREMRHAMQELQRELNTTREELKRGVLELPEEAREGAETMRRVVGDQIKALSDLSEIITRHGKQLDLSTPALGEPRMVRAVGEQYAPAAEAPAAGEGGQAQASRFAADMRRNGSNGAVPRQAPPPRAAQPRPVAAPAPASARAQAPEPQAAEEGNGGGWVSDLLRRASSDEETNGVGEQHAAAEAEAGFAGNGADAPAPVAAPQGTPLNALSADIARAIDHDAATELWTRHRRGERNLFTRRLYTMQGQQTFDEIRKKYQRDPEFRSVVDHYVTDFEKLLSEATTNNKDSQVGNRYLLSDTGKVYTMLAHASGHFD
jgi:ABC-type transporter Mla subunit MlaD